MAKTDITKQSQEAVDNIFLIAKCEGINIATLSSLSGISTVSINALKQDGSCSLQNLIRIMDALGYKVCFTKVKETMSIADSIEATNKLLKLKKRNREGFKKHQLKRTGGVFTKTQVELKETRSRKDDFLATD